MSKKFKMPTKSNLKSRISTINNAFAISITPYIKEDDELKIENYYKELLIKENQCVYCLREAKSVDHLFPLVKDGMPSGYISDINNLVPCCKDCNSKKGNKEFNEWYKDNKTKKYLKDECGLSDEQIKNRYEIICEFIKKHKKQYNFFDYLTKEECDKYIFLKNKIENDIKEADIFCKKIATHILNGIKKSR